MNVVSIGLLGLYSFIVQSAMIVVAKQFLDFHHERSLSAIGKSVTLTWVIFTLLSILSAMFAPSALHGLFSLVFFAFLALFIYLDAASRCLPRCFTQAFILTGIIFRFLFFPENVLSATLTALSVFGVLWGIRTLTYQRDGNSPFGLGDVYLMAGLGMWFSFPAILWIISGSAIAGSLFLLTRKLHQPMKWQQDINYRTVPFAPFLCVISSCYAVFLFTEKSQIFALVLV